MWSFAKRFNRVSLIFILCLAILVASASPARPGYITGRVIDEEGYIIPNARVTVKNMNTGRSTYITTDYSGFYRAEVEPGVYTVTVTHPGFKTYVRAGVKIEAAETVVVDLSVPYGDPTESVTKGDTSTEAEQLSSRERLNYLVGRWNVDGTYYPPWSDAPREENIRGKVSIEWDLDGLILSQLWEVRGESEETDERRIRILLHWDSAKDRWKLFWFDDRNNVEQAEGFWEGQSLILSAPASAEQPNIWITWQKESDATWTISVDVQIDGTLHPRFRARMTRK